MFDYSKIRNEVEYIWEFIFPPLINLFIVIFTYLFLTSLNLSKIQYDFIGTNLSLITENKLFEAFVKLGFEKIFIFILFILLAYFFNILNKIFLDIGKIVPISTQIYETELFIKQRTFKKFWRKYPDITEPKEIISIMKILVEEQQIKQTVIGKGYDLIEKMQFKNTSRVNFCKALILFLVFFSIILCKQVYLWRFLISFTVFLVALFYFLYYQIFLHNKKSAFIVDSAYSIELTNKKDTSLDEKSLNSFNENFKVKSMMGGWYSFKMGYQTKYILKFLEQRTTESNRKNRFAEQKQTIIASRENLESKKQLFSLLL